jgi:hypothetical protein
LRLVDHAIRLEAQLRMGWQNDSVAKPIPLLRRMRKWLLVLGGVGFVGVAGALLWRRVHGTVIYPASKGQPDWATHTDVVNGFEIRYPGNWHISQFKNFVNLYDDDTVSLGVNRHDMPLDELKRKATHGRFLPDRATVRDAVVAGLRCEQFHFSTGNFEGTKPVELFVIPRGATTYLVSWSPFYHTWRTHGPGKKLAAEDEALARAVISTFRFIDTRPNEQMSYTDPLGRFSFEYPHDWQLSAGINGSPCAKIVRGMDTQISVYSFPNTTADQFMQSRDITEATATRQWFAHRLVGRRALWMGSPTYVFERNSDLVVVTISRNKEPAEILNRFFDTFAVRP